VYIGDVIQTNATGQAQIQLLDRTKLVAGPSSTLKIDAFVFYSSGSAPHLLRTKPS
jgi:hypothetical protein